MARTYGQYCGVSAALEAVGERWALLIVRDLLVGPRRYTDLKQGLPRIPTNILSARLKELQEAGVVRRAHLAHCGLVYELTDAGRGLEGVVLALDRWGLGSLGEPEPSDAVTPDSVTIALRAAYRGSAGLPPTRYRVRLDQVDLLATATPDGLQVRPLAGLRPVDSPAGEAAADLEILAGPQFYALLAGRLTLDQAIDQGVVVAAAGDPALLQRFASSFLPQAGLPEAPQGLPDRRSGAAAATPDLKPTLA